MIYKDRMETLSVTIPIDVMEWVDKNGDLGEMVRTLLDQRMNKEAEFFIPEYKKPRRPHRGAAAPAGPAAGPSARPRSGRACDTGAQTARSSG